MPPGMRRPPPWRIFEGSEDGTKSPEPQVSSFRTAPHIPAVVPLTRLSHNTKRSFTICPAEIQTQDHKHETKHTIKVKQPTLFFRENSAGPEKRMHTNLSKKQGQTQRGKQTLNKQQQNPLLRMDSSFSIQVGLIYFTDQIFAPDSVDVKT